ncbi:MAG: hypothetical protein Q7J27_14775 [Syntrophales bacterium]|nr:hypothetical protein [Syntrophales bacterium]
MANNWDILFKIGGLAGLASFIWLLIKDFMKFYKKPKIKIAFSKDTDLRTWTFEDTGWVRKFATLNIKNNGKHTAKRCVAVMSILKNLEMLIILKTNVLFIGLELIILLRRLEQSLWILALNLA